MAESVLFEGKLANGVKIRMLEATSFSGREEVAIELDDKIISISSIEVSREGFMTYRPTKNTKQFFKLSTAGAVEDALNDTPSANLD